MESDRASPNDVPASPIKHNSKLRLRLQRVLSSNSTKTKSMPVSPSSPEWFAYDSRSLENLRRPLSVGDTDSSISPIPLDKVNLESPDVESKIRLWGGTKQYVADLNKLVMPAVRLPQGKVRSGEPEVRSHVGPGPVGFGQMGIRQISTGQIEMTSPAIKAANQPKDNGKSESGSTESTPRAEPQPEQPTAPLTAWWRVFKLANLLMQQGC